MYVTVVLPDRLKGLNDGLTYEAIEGADPGMLVRIPVRAKYCDGVVIDVTDGSVLSAAKMRAVQSVLSRHPLITPALLTTAKWMAAQYVTSVRTVLAHMLPPPPWRVFLPARQRMYRLRKDANGRSTLQKAIIGMLKNGECGEEELMTATGASRASLATLVKRGITESYEREIRGESLAAYASKQIALPDAWRTALRTIEASAAALALHHAEDERVQLYAALIDKAMTRQKSVIVIAPEFTQAKVLAEKLGAIVSADHVFLFDPDASRQARARLHRTASAGSPCVIVGTRSALFLPLSNLGRIIIDDEHDWLLKSERTPMYHARDVAEVLCKESGSALLLASACPSLESWYAATEQKRFPVIALPALSKNTASIVDLREVQFGTSYPLSPASVMALQTAYNRGEQSVAFLNHRGSATGIVCTECKQILSLSPDGRPLTVHTDASGRPVLRDHATGSTMPVPERCPACGAHALHSIGAGTQAVEKLLKKFLPDARIVRFDRDTTRGKARRALFDRFFKEEFDIAVGTQSVLPALLAPRVTCAVALLADVGLSLPHIRAGERSLQLLSALTAVLARPNGECIIQTFNARSREALALQQDEMAAYLDEELILRKSVQAPPWQRTATVITRGPGARKRAEEIATLLRSVDAKARIQGTASLASPMEYFVHVQADDLEPFMAKLKKRGGATVDITPLYRF